MDKAKLLEVIETLEDIIRELNYSLRSRLNFSVSDIEEITDTNEFQYLVDAVYAIVDGIEHLDTLVTELKEKKEVS